MLRVPAGALRPCTRSTISPQHMHHATGAPDHDIAPCSITIRRSAGRRALCRVSALARHACPALLARQQALGLPARALPGPPRRVHLEPGAPAPAQRGAQAQARHPRAARLRGGGRAGVGTRARVCRVRAQAAACGSRCQCLPRRVRCGGGVRPVALPGGLVARLWRHMRW